MHTATKYYTFRKTLCFEIAGDARLVFVNPSLCVQTIISDNHWMYCHAFFYKHLWSPEDEFQGGYSQSELGVLKVNVYSDVMFNAVGHSWFLHLFEWQD